MHSLLVAFLHYTGSSNVSGPWYGFWSGFGSDLGIFAGAALFVRHQNCSVKGCWRHGRHSFSGLKVCQKHHPSLPTGERITATHLEAM